MNQLSQIHPENSSVGVIDRRGCAYNGYASCGSMLVKPFSIARALAVATKPRVVSAVPLRKEPPSRSFSSSMTNLTVWTIFQVQARGTPAQGATHRHLGSAGRVPTRVL